MDSQTGKTGLSILYVEDDLGDVAIMQQYLESSDISYKLTVESDPYTARELIEGNKFDCLIFDYHYPQGRATDIFKDLFQAPAVKRPAIIVLTGDDNLELASGIMKSGAQEYLLKRNLDSQTLQITIHSACQRVVDEHQAYDEMSTYKRMSLYDSLTGLPNRSLFIDRGEQLIAGHIRTSVGFALLMIDLDGFKDINDTYGHGIGDDVLIIMADRLLDAFREVDTVCRLSGDEFAVLLPTMVDHDVVHEAVAKLDGKLKAPIELGKVRISPSASVGVALFPEDGADLRDLLATADGQMYRSKRSRNSKVVDSFNPQIHEKMSHRGALFNGFDVSQMQSQFVTYFQPQVAIRTGEIIGYEALVRWRHPQLGLLPPSKFLSAIENSSLLEEMTRLTLRAALQFLGSLPADESKTTVSVNFSPRVAHRKSCVECILGEIEDYGVSPGRLCLEITEASFIHSPALVEQMLNGLAERGVKVSIDDFGTSYSSLSYLRRFPLSELKIDRDFIEMLPGSEQDRALIQTIISIAHSFGAYVVAEGIESVSELALLDAWGCEVAQGYLIGQAMPVLELNKWRQSWPARWQQITEQRAKLTAGLSR